MSVKDSLDTNKAMSRSYGYMMKLLLIGDSSVGKSCLLLRFTDDAFTPSFITTIGIDFRIRIVQINNSRIKAQIWDTAGQERFRTITTAYYRGAQGILLVYDITKRTSFNNVANWMQQLKSHSSDNVTIILVGNKCDLSDKREVSFEEGMEKAKTFGCAFFETSAKNSINVETAFTDLMKTVYSGWEGRSIPIPGNNLPLRLQSSTVSNNGCC